MKPGIPLLLVDDDATFARVMANELGRMGFTVSTAGSGAEALARVAAVVPSVVLLDLNLPDMNGLEVLKALRERQPGTDVIMLTGHGSIDTAIESVRIGAFDYLMKPCPLDELEVRIQRALERQALQQRASLLERGLTPPDPGSSFIGESPPFVRMMRLIERVAPTDSSVLITGETGTGKEMVAQLIHARSHRHGRPFVVVECAALQESLLQSELFGHERGAFTGADRAKPGLFEVANGGTVFLDEIGEVSLATQVKLLRVLDTSCFRHVGGTREIHVNVRVLAATNRDMPALIRQGLFREDFFYRLSTILVVLPPLRERRSDIALLSGHFVAQFNERYGVHKRLGAEAAEILARHEWPGNVRELLHSIEAALVVCEGSEIRPEHLPAALRSVAGHHRGGDAAAGRFPSMQEVECAHIERALRETAGHRESTAQLLGISERSLYRKIREYGLAD